MDLITDFKPKIYQGDCIDMIPLVSLPRTIDLVIADLPYGTTYAKWDTEINLDLLWPVLLGVVKKNTAIVLTASQPFTSRLVMSQPTLFRVEWIWDKVNGANFANTVHQPLKTHESILVFSQERPRYFPQKTPGRINHKQGSSARPRDCETQRISTRAADDLSGLKHPKSIQTFPKHSSQSRWHSTEKPVPLLEYFINTYSTAGDTVLDFCAGSGSTGAAAQNLGRHSILIDRDPAMVAIMRERLWT